MQSINVKVFVILTSRFALIIGFVEFLNDMVFPKHFQGWYASYVVTVHMKSFQSKQLRAERVVKIS